MDRARLLQLLPDRAADALRRASTLPHRDDLDRLAISYRTDKASVEHGYARYYQRHLSDRRAVTSLLEIGIGGENSKWGYESRAGGMSLRMWQDYFPKAQIVGLDLFEKNVRGPRIHVERGSQDDPEVLARLVSRYGPFDVVIDDGSHIGRHQWASFTHLFPAVKPAGFYIIEDLATAYDPHFEGGKPGAPGTSVTLLNDGIDYLLRRHWQGADVPPVAAMHVYDEIAFLMKAPGPA